MFGTMCAIDLCARFDRRPPSEGDEVMRTSRPLTSLNHDLLERHPDHDQSDPYTETIITTARQEPPHSRLELRNASVPSRLARLHRLGLVDLLLSFFH